MARCDSPDSMLQDVDNLNLSAYKPPAPKSVREILDADADDESLRRYKESLLGKVESVIVDPADSRIVILKSITLLSDGHPDIMLNVNANLQDISFRVKEGIMYRLRFQFYVQREMVTGLRYSHRVTKLGVPVMNEQLMVGSYAPKHQLIDYVTPQEEAPSGLLARGKYKVHSKFADDYGTVFAKWDWVLEIAKAW